MDAPLLGAKLGNDDEPPGAYGAMRPPSAPYDGMTRVADTREVHRPAFSTESSTGVYCCTTPLAGFLGILCCPLTVLGMPTTVPPRHEAVGTVFGKYVATWKSSGLYFINPCGLNLRYVSVNNRTHELQSIKVADAMGNSLVVSGVITYRVVDTTKAALDMVVMSSLVFAGIFLIGDPVAMMISPDASEVERDAVRASLGLDRPLWVQYLAFMNAAVHGDFGKSFLAGQPAMQLIFERMPATLELVFLSLVIALVFGLPMGVYAGLKPRSVGAKSIMTGSILGFSLPNFWVGLMLIMVFAVLLPDLIPGWPRLPASGRGATVNVLGVKLSLFTADGLLHLLLPALTLALYKGALIVRLARATAREVLPMDYIKFARAKGLSERRVVGVHVLKNIMIPIATVSGLEFGQSVAFAVITETVFSWPGMGKLLLDSILLLDRPVVVAYLMIIVVFFVVLNLLVDLLYSVLDPRVRLESRAT